MSLEANFGLSLLVWFSMYLNFVNLLRPEFVPPTNIVYILYTLMHLWIFPSCITFSTLSRVCYCLWWKIFYEVQEFRLKPTSNNEYATLLQHGRHIAYAHTGRFKKVV